MKKNNRPLFRPSLELLEDRLAPVTYTVNTLNDPAPATMAWNAYNANGCSLRWALNDLGANGGVANAINIQVANGGTISLTNALPTITKNVTITGPGANNPVTIARAANANALFSVFNVSNFTVTIQGLTISGGDNNNEGGGVRSEGALTLKDDTISGNTTSGEGGGVYSIGPELTIDHTTIIGNSSAYGGGIFIWGGDNVIKNESSISNNNEASQRGGGVFIQGGDLVINASSLNNNDATFGGGGIAMERDAFGIGSSVTIAGQVTVNHNWVSPATGPRDVDSQGGGIYINSSTLTLANNATLTVNTNTANLGGGIFNAEGNVNANNGVVIIVSNQARANGGGIYNNSGTMNFTGATISTNTARGFGGGAFSLGTPRFPAVINLTRVTSAGNRATLGGMGSFEDGTKARIMGGTLALNTATLEGGAIYVDGGSVNVTQDTIANNSAPTGGGIYEAAGDETTIVTKSSIVNNSTDGVSVDGGAATVLDQDKISNNGGDGVSLLSGTGIQIQQTQVTLNTVYGLLVSSGVTDTIQGDTFTGNGAYDLELQGGTTTSLGTNVAGKGQEFAGLFEIQGTLDVSSYYELDGGVTSVGTMNDYGTYNQTGGTLTGSGYATVSQALNWSGGLMSGTGTTESDGLLTITGISETLEARTLLNVGTGYWNSTITGWGGLFKNNGSLSGTGILYGNLADNGSLYPGGAGVPNGIGVYGAYTENGALYFDLGTYQGNSDLMTAALVNLSGNLKLNPIGYPLADSYVLIENSGSNAVNGTFNGLPQGAVINVGGKNYQISYQGSSSGAYTGGQNVVLDLAYVVLNNPGNQYSLVGSTINLPLSASDTNGNPLSFSATGLPNGLTINASTGVISGVATTAGEFPVTVTVTDTITDLSVTQTFTWYVGPNKGVATALSASSSGLLSGQTFTFSATPASAYGLGTPTGSVAFYDNGSEIGSAALNGSGTSTLAVSDLPVGYNAVSAMYSGDSDYAPSTSANVGVTVSQAASQLSVTLPSDADLGQAIDVTVSVTAITPAGGTPTGTVTLSDGSNILDVLSLSGGTANQELVGLPVGNDMITATYSGDVAFTSTYVQTPITIEQGNTTTSLNLDPSSLTVGQAFTLTASVTGASLGMGIPTGTVTFYDGTTNLGSSALDLGEATFVISSYTAGTHSFTASYSGDGNFNGSTSPSGPVSLDLAFFSPYNQELTVSSDVGLLTSTTGTDTNTLQVVAINGNTAAVGSAITTANGATLTVQSDGSFTYVDTAGFVGADTITFTISDGTSSSTATVTVNDVNTVASDMGFSTPIGQSLTTTADVGLLTSAMNYSGNALTISAVNGSAANVGTAITTSNGGTFTVQSDGSFVYVPATGFVGTDSVTYTVSDGVSASTATLTVGVVDTTANDAIYLNPYNQTLTASASTDGLLLNASDQSGLTLTVTAINGDTSAIGSSITTAEGGTLTVQANGSFTYVPASGFVGTDSVVYTVSDGVSTSMAVLGVNVVDTVANDVSYSNPYNQTLTVSARGGLLPNASDQSSQTLSVTAINGSTAAIGTAITTAEGGTLTVQSNGSFTYVPASGYVGWDGFSYTVSDGISSATAWVTLKLTDAIAVNEFYSVVHDGTLTVASGTGLLNGASDADGNALTVVAVNGDTGAIGSAETTFDGGSVTVQSNGSFVYTPPAGFAGVDKFAFKISDGTTTSWAIATIDVTAPTVTSVVVNGDPGDDLAGTHSRVATLYVTFSEAVQLGSGAFTLSLDNNVDENGVTGQQAGVIPATLNWTSTDNIHWTITFAGTNGVDVNVGADGHVTIMDGVYDLTVVATQVHPLGESGVNMASNYNRVFWALFGDTGASDSITTGTIGDGNTTVGVGNGDYNAFANAYGATGYNVARGYNASMDVNGDGGIGNVDFNAFANNYETIWTF